MFVKHVCSPKLKCHCNLDLCPRNPKFKRGHLLVISNHHIKLDVPWAMRYLVIDRTRFVNRPPDQHVQSNIPPLFRRGGGCKNKTYVI